MLLGRELKAGPLLEFRLRTCLQGPGRAKKEGKRKFIYVTDILEVANCDKKERQNERSCPESNRGHWNVQRDSSESSVITATLHNRGDGSSRPY